ncbi:MFS transporter [Kribbella speibonae]|uniref:MFS transporter n=1 Tax=Kribbella speibonae TaxID=1572660 RepID=A0A4R0I9K9_9ACTN|nr:MFS transporter [Kribbella speibonae]
MRGSGAFGALWGARAVSVLGDSLGLVALLLYVQASTGAAIAVALLLLAGDFVPGLFGAFAGVVGDRFDLRRVMVVCDLVQGALTLVMALVLPPLEVLLVMVAVRSVAAQVFLAASRSALPALVRDDQLEAANSALGAGTSGLEAVGPIVAAGLFLVTDVRGILLVDAVTFFVSAGLLARLPKIPPTEATGHSVLKDARDGLGYILRTAQIRVIGIGFFATVAFNGVDDVAMVFLAKDELRGSDSASATLYAGVGIGLIVGFAILARYAGRLTMPILILLGFAVSSAGNLVTGLAWAIWAALALQVIRGLGIAGVDVGVNTHLQRVVPPQLRSRVFGNLYGAIGLAAGISYVLGGLLLQHTDARTTFVTAGVGGLIATAATAIAMQRSGREEREPPVPR